MASPLYVTVAEFENYLGVSSGWETAMLERALVAAEAKVDQFCGRSFLNTGDDTARTFRAVSPGLCVVDDVISILSVETTTGGRSGTWVNFDLDNVVQETHGDAFAPVQMLRADWGYFPVGPRSWVRVTPNVGSGWGWDRVPDAVPAAVMLQAAKIYTRKDSPGGHVQGYQAISTTQRLKGSGLDVDAEALLEELVRTEKWLP